VELITTHPSADFDGAASMVAARHLYPGAVLAFSGSTEEKVREFFATAPVTILSPAQVDMEQVRRVILCDTHTAERAGHFAALCRRVPVHAFDHHPLAPDEAPLEMADIDTVGATTTLMAERLAARGITPAPWEATLMALGIYEETGCLTFATTTPRDLKAALWALEHGADLGVVRRTLATELSLPQLELLDALAHGVEVRYLDGYKAGVAATHASGYVPEVAALANRLLAMEPMDCLVVLIGMEEKILLVARGSRTGVPLGDLAREFGGGGHPTAASAMLHGFTLVEAADAVWEALERLLVPLSRAADIMTADPVGVPRSTPLQEVGELLTRYGINAAPVLEPDGGLAGVITREAVQKAIAHQMPRMAAAEVMDTEPYTVTPDTPLREVRERMVERNQRFTPVLDGHRLVGCITRTDLLRTLHDDLRPQPEAAGPLPVRPAKMRGVDHLMRRHLPPAVHALLREIGDQGDRAGVRVFMAGGLVRDLLLGQENLDVDLVVEGDAIDFATRWAATCQGARVHSHARFGTATVTLERDGLPPRFKVDLATTRTEFYDHPSALPRVEHSSLKKDLYRRDFTINALAVALNREPFGTLIDYFGGQRDLKDRKVRVLHTLSLIDDPTRALRAVRFATRLDFRIGQQTEHLILGAARLGLYTRLSGKRLLTELRHLLTDRDPVRAVEELDRLEILAGIHPRLQGSEGLTLRMERARDAVSWYRLQFAGRALAVWQVYLLALAAPLSAGEQSALWERLKLAGRLSELWRRWGHLAESVATTLPADPQADPVAVHACLHGAPDEVLVHLMAASQQERVQTAVALYLSRLKTVRPALTGRDLQKLGIPEGPVYREILEGLLRARLEGRVEGKAEELEWVRHRGYTAPA